MTQISLPTLPAHLNVKFPLKAPFLGLCARESLGNFEAIDSKGAPLIPTDPLKRTGHIPQSHLKPATKIVEQESAQPVSDQFKPSPDKIVQDAKDQVKRQSEATAPSTRPEPQAAVIEPSGPEVQTTLMMEEPTPTEQSVNTPLVAEYRPAETAADVANQARLLPQIARSAVARDISQVLGASPQDMKDRYFLEGNDAHVADAAHAFAYTVLDDLSVKVLKHTEGAEFHGLDVNRMSLDRVGDATAQHVGYVAGELSRELKDGPGREISRILVRSHFEGKLKNTRSNEQQDDLTSRQLLARELGKVSGDSEGVEGFVNSSDRDYLFSTQNMTTESSLLPNLASYHAGEATLQFASKLMGGDDKRAEAFVKHVFGRSAGELKQMLRDPQGLPGVLVNFSAMAHHQAWQFAKLGAAGVAAEAGEAESAVKKWNHSDIGPTRKVVVEDPDSADKIGDQVESYLLREGKLVPCERSAGDNERPLSDLLTHVEKNGIFTSGSDNMRVLSPESKSIKERLLSDVNKASRLSDWRAANELAGDVVAHTCANFAAQAVKADFQQKDRLVTLYRDAIERFSPQLDKMLANGAPDKKDASYQAFFQELAGEFGFEALKSHMGVGNAHDMVRKANVSHLIPIACDALRLKQSDDFSAQNIVSDIAELKDGLLKGDYFLGKDGFVEGMQKEAEASPVDVDRTDLENGIRIPNAVWMWTQLTRGLVENKPGRYSGGEADMSSDAFPSNVQFNPPDIRDVELFVWARHRLSEAGQPPKKATRMALATVVLTLYKDLVQLRKAA
jgi:hypothetical protein